MWARVVFLILLISVGASLAYLEIIGREKPLDVVFLSEATNPLGTPSRVEREFKFGFSDDTLKLFLDTEFANLQWSIYQGLANALETSRWHAPDISRSPYILERVPLMAVFRDIYFDSDDRAFCNNSLVYRIRHRFRSPSELHNHETEPTSASVFPYRAEVQAKTGRKELGDGFSTVNESRIEFDKSRAPFSDSFLPPQRPWHPRDLIEDVKSGTLKGTATAPAHLLATTLRSMGKDEPISVTPSVVLISTRLRMHLNMKTDFGSGPNPEQAFIITIDRVDASNGKKYMEFLSRGWYEGEHAQRPSILATTFEVEIEFERNVSTRLDEVIDASGRSTDIALRDAFLNDQKNVLDIVIGILKDNGYDVFAMAQSKFQQSCRL